MAYRFAAAVGLVGLVAGMPAPLPAGPEVTVTVTRTAGAPVATQTVQAQQWQPQAQAQPQPQVQPQQPQQPNRGGFSATSSQSTPAQPTSSSQPSSPKSGSGAKYGGGICVDGTMGDTQSAAQKVAGSNPSVKWWNNWSDKGSDLPSGAKFFPMLHAPGQSWSGTPKGEVALSYNEADISNPDPSSLCSAWKTQYLAPAKAAGLKTTTPSITSSDCAGGDKTKGTCWMSSFMKSCGGDAADMINAHFYLGKDPTNFARGGSDPDYQYFTKYIDTLAAYGKPVIISELGLDPYAGTWSTQQVSTFMGAAVKYLESRSEVVGWAGYQVGTKPGNMNPADPSSITNVLSAIVGGK